MSDQHPPDGDGTIDGFSLEQLTDYLDRGRSPRDPDVEASDEAQNALDALARLRRDTSDEIEKEAKGEEPHGDHWIAQILEVIMSEARAGRDIPLDVVEDGRIEITEGAVRGMIRAAGDRAGDLLIGRCRLLGDVTVAAEPITIDIEASGVWGHDIPAAVNRFRSKIYSDLALHTLLNIEAVNVTIRDLHVPAAARNSPHPGAS